MKLTRSGGRLVKNGWDFWNNDPDPEDDHNHGTAVSGVIQANSNNDFAMTGLNW